MPDDHPAVTGTATLSHLLPHRLPDDANTRLALFAIRRLGAYGLNDAHVVQAFVGRFGEGFRRPLLMMRAFMHELAATATQPIAIAPCCCARTTPSETALISVLQRVADAPRSANLLLSDQLGCRTAHSALACAAAVAAAFADAGRPIV